ncbi:23S rRNA (guanosine(2251)-2'-O)-methyltransferase RlmB [Flagellimonas allohymeniacidonis]|uniref:23S rRNA (Guanosine(2251)-2'-O)-methyltransferase RlmB n=1 Tax=Flagellimonas allohymeniacidonis TaxID=2517819 RepID=A0A4Q8QGK9_9FLAO|nr:23S rRNA (guanosine(2251)-2'-O)-methyltransferase RlmB [Allomuricauda hymeniacidonis]TAI49685.1 23S rRNA (guanosine(2251)-2'-O)-methyltransferase RlmB [Allomuricauda hymeniacidonis]
MNDKNQIYGLRATIEAIEAERPINKIYLQRGLQGDLFKELETLIRKKGLSSSYVPLEKLNRLTKSNHQGVVASISPVVFQEFGTLVESVISEKSNAFFLLLDHITDVRNFGAIIRTAECCGVDAIVIPKTGAAPITDDTIKTSAGAAFNIPITKVDHLKDAIFYLQSCDVSVVAATEKAENTLYNLNLVDSCAIIMGAEDKGISPSILKIVDHGAKLPMLGKIGSLNVSVACGVVLYEVVRQRLG